MPTETNKYTSSKSGASPRNRTSHPHTSPGKRHPYSIPISDVILTINRHFTDEEKKDQWVRVVAPVGEAGVSNAREAKGPAPVHSPLSLRATLLSPGKSLSHELSATSSKAYVHVVQTSGYNPSTPSGNTVRVD